MYWFDVDPLRKKSAMALGRLLPDEEPALLAQCSGLRKHLSTMIPFAIGTGARKSEQLGLRVRQCDFFRNLVLFDRTKSGRTRLVEMNSEVRGTLLELCKGKRPDDYGWVNPATGGPYTDIKHSFVGACADAKIEGLVWHDLRATYGTRLGEAGFNAYDIAKLMGHANISTSQRYRSQFTSRFRRGSAAKKSAPSQYRHK